MVKQLRVAAIHKQVEDKRFNVQGGTLRTAGYVTSGLAVALSLVMVATADADLLPARVRDMTYGIVLALAGLAAGLVLWGETLSGKTRKRNLQQVSSYDVKRKRAQQLGCSMCCAVVGCGSVTSVVVTISGHMGISNKDIVPHLPSDHFSLCDLHASDMASAAGKAVLLITQTPLGRGTAEPEPSASLNVPAADAAQPPHAEWDEVGFPSGFPSGKS
jgi:hypothetical protein